MILIIYKVCGSNSPFLAWSNSFPCYQANPEAHQAELHIFDTCCEINGSGVQW